MIAWLTKAKKGEKVVYFDGFLMRERQKFLFNNRGQGYPEKILTALMAWRAYLEGVVVLVQHKRDEGEYEYIAIKV